MVTWIVGDVHGCASELRSLVRELALAPTDRLLACGDLFHRGPDPLGVIEVLRAAGAAFLLGNHERVLLERWGVLDPHAPPAPFPRSGKVDLSGDGGRPLAVDPERAGEVIDFLRGHAGTMAGSRDLAGAGPTPDGRDWVAVHAGIDPQTPLDRQRDEVLVSQRRLPLPGRPWWYEAWHGPELIVFGHTPSQVPRVRRVDGRLVALGIDTGCVYGGALSAYCPETDSLRHVRAERAYAAHA